MITEKETKHRVLQELFKSKRQGEINKEVKAFLKE